MNLVKFILFSIGTVAFAKKRRISTKPTCKNSPKNPDFGATWECLSDHHSSCDLKVDPDFKCWNGVTCGRKGEWIGRVKCRFNRKRPTVPPQRPNGDYKCRNSKCRFFCDDSRYAGRAIFNRKSGAFRYETVWDSTF